VLGDVSLHGAKLRKGLEKNGEGKGEVEGEKLRSEEDNATLQNHLFTRFITLKQGER